MGDQPIPTLASLLALVDGRVPLLLEAKVDHDIRRWVPALKRDLAAYRGRFGVMSFDPRLPRLLKTQMPDVLRGLVLRDSLPPLSRSVAMALADPQFLVGRTAGARQILGAPRRANACPSTAGPIRTAGSARKRRFMPTPPSGKPMADRESEVLARIASGVAPIDAAAWDRLAGGDPFLSHAFLSALEDSGSVGPGTGWTRHRS